MARKIRGLFLGLGSRYVMVIWFLMMALSILPLIDTVNDLLTQAALRTGIYHLLERYVVPVMTRMIGSTLMNVLGIKTVVKGGHLYLITRGLPYEVQVVWNCVGWQSFVLLTFTLLTVLQGTHSLRSKVKCAILGLEGVVIINLLRIALASLLLVRWGYGPAITFHDYCGPIITFSWLSTFWYVSDRFILEPPSESDEKHLASRLKDSLKNLNLKNLLPDFIFGRRVMGLTMMVIILSMTALNGIALLSVKASGSRDPTILSFEHLDGSVVMNGIETDRIMTTPEFTSLGQTAYEDVYEGGFMPVYVEMWNFYLYGPLETSYNLQGSVKYVLWLHIDSSPKEKKSFSTYIRLKIYDVDESGNSNEVSSETFRIKLTKKPKEFVLDVDPISEHNFAVGPTVRLGIEILDCFGLDYIIEYDSESRHSHIDLPGMVVPDKLEHLCLLAFITPMFKSASGRAREKRMGESDRG